MSIKTSLSLIFLSTLLSLAIFLIFLNFVDPKEGGVFAPIILLSSLFSFLLGIFTILFIILKFRTLKDQGKIFEKFASAFRQAILVSLFLVAIILLRFFKLLEYRTTIASFLFFLLLEILFSTRKKRFTYKI